MNALASILTLASSATNPLAIELVKVLACAGIAAALLGRLRVSVIPGYLIAGTLLATAPSVLKLLGGPDLMIVDPSSMEQISGLAVTILMFGIGLHLDINSLRQGLGVLLTLGVTTTMLSALALGSLAATMGWSPGAAIALGMAFSQSSTAVVIRLLQQGRELSQTHGRLCLSILIVQDICAVAMLIALPAIGSAFAPDGPSGAGPPGPPLPSVEHGLSGPWWWLGKAAIVSGLLLALWKLAPRVLYEASRNASSEVALVLAAAIALGAAALSAWIGLSSELGAFVAGFVLAATPFRFQISGQLVPLRDLFLAIFFTAVGLKLDLTVIAPSWWVVLIGLVAVVSVKSVVIAGTHWLIGGTVPTAARVGLFLAGAGEFSLVILAVALSLRLIDQASFTGAAAVVVGSLILSAPVAGVARRLAPKLSGVPRAPWWPKPLLLERDHDLAPSDAARAIVAGFGPVGRAVADALARRGLAVTIIEINPQTVQRQFGLGRSVVYGDARNPEVLDQAGIHHAAVVVLTVPDEDAVLAACRTARALNPAVFIAARANTVSKGMMARELGADDVVIEELVTAEAMAGQVIDGLTRREAAAAIDEAPAVTGGAAPDPADADR